MIFFWPVCYFFTSGFNINILLFYFGFDHLNLDRVFRSRVFVDKSKKSLWSSSIEDLCVFCFFSYAAVINSIHNVNPSSKIIGLEQII